MIQITHIGLILVLFSLTNCEPESNCSTEGIIINSHNSQICCDGEVYTTKRYNKFDDSCNVEPKDEALSYEESMWLAYECNVRRWLESASLGFMLKSFVTLMSQLLPEERQENLWKKDMSDRVSTEGSEERRKATIIKQYVNEYVRAIEEVCTYGSETATSTSLDKTEIKRRQDTVALVHPGIKCKNGDVPEYIHNNFPGNANHDTRTVAEEEAQIDSCKKQMRTYVLNIKKSRQVIYNATRFCFLIIYEDFKLNQLENPDVDFESIVTGFFPKFWSKSTKTVAKDAVFKMLQREYPLDGVTQFKDLVPEMIKVTEDNLKAALLESSETIEQMDFVVKVFLTHHIYNVCNYVRYYVMCQKGGVPF